MASSSDNFNRADENPISDGGNWTPGPGASDNVQVVTNRARLSTVATEGTARRVSPSFAAAQYAQCTVTTRTDTNDYAGPAVRIASTTDADQYFLRPAYLDTTFNIRRIDDTGTLAGTTLGAAFGTFAVNDVLRLDMVGTLLIAKQNGTILATRVDATYSSGQPGFHIWAEDNVNNAEIDDWSAADILTTRLYLPASGASPINFSFAAGWEKTSGADRIQSYHEKTSTAMANKTCSENVSTNPYDVLARQYAYGPLAAQTISGTVRGIIRTLESNGAADFRAQLVIKIMDDDGTTVRGTLLDFDTSALTSEFPSATAASRMFPVAWTNVVLTSQTAQAGDYLVIEIGIRSHNGATTNRTATFRLGDTGSDRTEDETATDDNAPWIEFDSKLILQTLAPNIGETTISITEDHRAHILLQPQVVDTVTIEEGVTVEIASTVSPISVSVFDTVTIEESQRVHILLQPQVFDASTVEEFSAVNFHIEPQAGDTTTVEESSTVLLTSLNPEVADALTVTEDQILNLLLFPQQGDTITTQEAVVAHVLLQPQLSDDISVTEAQTLNLLVQPAPFDTIAVEESSTTFLPFLVPSVFDAVTIAEATFIGLVIQAEEIVTVTDATATHLLSFIFLENQVFLDERVDVRFRLEISVSDSLTITEATTLIFPVYLFASASSDVTIEESSLVAISEPLLPISMSDTITIAESLNLMFPLNNPIEDTILVEDFAGIEIAGGTLEIIAHDDIGALTSVGRLPALTLIE